MLTLDLKRETQQVQVFQVINNYSKNKNRDIQRSKKINFLYLNSNLYNFKKIFKNERIESKELCLQIWLRNQDSQTR